jgi:hypothetical protein
MSQELKYLRNEMNQRISFFYEHAQKTISIVLLIWGGTSIIFGTTHINFVNITPYFIGGTIFFISNLMVYFSAQKGWDNVDCIFKIAAYIAVFYEKKPSKTIKIGNNLSWEIVNFETQAKNTCCKTIDKKRIYNMNGEYMAFMMVSVFGILFFTAMFLENSEFKENLEIFLFSICLLYLFISLFLFNKTIKYSSLKDIVDIKKKHFEDFLKYSFETEHYTKEDIEERFGDFWQNLKYFEIEPSAKRKSKDKINNEFEKKTNLPLVQAGDEYKE